MKKYYIKFSWSKQVFYNDLKMDEYFTPYSAASLLDLINDKRLRMMINHDIDPSIRLSELLQKTNKRRNFVEAPEAEIIWLNNQEDIDIPSLFDYLSDIHVVSDWYVLLENNERDSSYDVISTNEMSSRLLLDCSKIIISIILCFNTNKDLNNSEGYELRFGFLQAIRKKYSLSINDDYLEKIAKGDNRNVLDLLNQIIRATIVLINQTDAEKKFQKMEEFIRSVNVDVSLHKWRNKNGCYAIMTEEDGTPFFALSSVKDYHIDKECDRFSQLANEIIACFDNTYNKKVGDPRLSTNKIRWAFLNDNVESFFSGKTRLKEPIVLSADNRINDWEKNKGEIGRDYGCCERKLFSFTQKNKINTFYIRWAPCYKCEPAFEQSLSRYKFAYFDFKDYLKSK